MIQPATEMRKAFRLAPAALIFLLVALGVGIELFVRSLSPRARSRVEKALEDRFDADVDLQSLKISLFPKPTAVAEGLVLRHKGWTDPKPLISIRRFVAQTDLLTVIGGKNHVDLLELQGLAINLPPRGPSSEKQQIEGSWKVESGEPGQDRHQLSLFIEKIIADGTLLEIAPKIPGKNPLRFDIQKLTLHSVGPGQAMAFTATLTNPKPPGLIDSTGTFGPWQRDDPRATAVSGDYTFKDADLGVFKGISGTLSSAGKYHGVLQHIKVDGTTDTPNFALKAGGSPVHLKTGFHSVVDGMNGDTLLNPVDAQFLNTEFVCRGGVVHQPGPNGKTVSLDAVTKRGRIEDILTLVLGSNRPILSGNVSFSTKIVIPQGDQDVLDKLDLDGRFAIGFATFASEKAQQRIDTLSNRARGISKDEEPGQASHMVASNFRARFKLDNGVVSFSRLAFEVPGALISLTGKYKMRSEQVDMQGLFQMHARLSETQSGVKHWLLKPLDPIFAKNGVGFQVPITITGTKDHPEIGTKVFHKEFTIH